MHENFKQVKIIIKLHKVCMNIKVGWGQHRCKIVLNCLVVCEGKLDQIKGSFPPLQYMVQKTGRHMELIWFERVHATCQSLKILPTHLLHFFWMSHRILPNQSQLPPHRNWISCTKYTRSFDAVFNQSRPI
jgi:hypothetical protein